MARWISGIILAVAVICLLLYVPPFYLKRVIVALSVMACWEFLSISMGHKAFIKILGCVFAGAGCAILVLSPLQPYFLEYLFFLIFMSFVMQFFGDDDQATKIKNSAFFLMGILYSAILFALLARLVEQEHYKFWLFLTLGCTFLGDTGAYLIGKKFGRHKLAPTISPGKTIEGVLGAMVGGLVGAYVMRYLFWPESDLGLTMAIGALIVLFGIIGDLSESLLKRGFGVKDSGTLIPGHGGFLDRIDALLFSAPFVYFASKYFV